MEMAFSLGEEPLVYGIEPPEKHRRPTGFLRISYQQRHCTCRYKKTKKGGSEGRLTLPNSIVRRLTNNSVVNTQ